MGNRLQKHDPQPAIIISSSAVRAQTTAIILATTIGYSESDITIDDRLYGAEPKDVMSIIAELDETIDCAMLVGHNPTFITLVNALGHCNLDTMPTCSMAVLTFSTNSWKKLAKVQGTLVDFDFPKQ